MHPTNPALPDDGIVVVAGRRYLSPEALARALDVTPRTLLRWHSDRAGPPRTTVGRRPLYSEDRLGEWLAGRETQPVRPQRRRRGGADASA